MYLDGARFRDLKEKKKQKKKEKKFVINYV